MAVNAALACAPHDPDTLESPDPCGVVDPTDAPTSVDVERLCEPPVLRFVRGSAELDDGATCPLAQVAACLVGLDRHLIIGGHAASGEVASEEAAILLADRRAEAVRAILRERGVPSERAQAIAYGTLEASDAYDPREQRVELLWQDHGTSAATFSPATPTAAERPTTGRPPRVHARAPRHPTDAHGPPLNVE